MSAGPAFYDMMLGQINGEPLGNQEANTLA